jgi:hypothetical protein
MVCDEVLVLCQRCGARNRLEDLGLSTIGTYNQGLHFFGLARRIAVPMMAPRCKLLLLARHISSAGQ